MATVLAMSDFDLATRSTSGFLLRYIAARSVSNPQKVSEVNASRSAIWLEVTRTLREKHRTR